MKKILVSCVLVASMHSAVFAGDTLQDAIKNLDTAISELTSSIAKLETLNKMQSATQKSAASQKTDKKASSVDVKITSVGEDKTIGDLISMVAAGAKKGAKADSEKPFDYKLKPKKVADNVWCFFGALDKPTKENAGFMANSCYIKTKDGYFLMDTGPSYEFARQAYAAMSKIAKLPVKYIVNSHHHDDHWLGNDFYKKKFNAHIIGPSSINENYKDGDPTRMFKILPKNAIKGTHIIKVDEVPKKKKVIKFGGEDFVVIPMDVKAHTVDDIYLYLPKRKVLFAGDLVMNGRITSNRDGSVMGQIKAINDIKKYDWNVLVPGHGLNTGKDAAKEAELYFKLLKERIMKALENDVDATEITEKVKLKEFKDKKMYDILNAQNVGYAYDELEMLDDE